MAGLFVCGIRAALCFFFFAGVLVNGKDAGLRIVFIFQLKKEKAMCCMWAGQKA